MTRPFPARVLLAAIATVGLSACAQPKDVSTHAAVPAAPQVRDGSTGVPTYSPGPAARGAAAAAVARWPGWLRTAREPSFSCT